MRLYRYIGLSFAKYFASSYLLLSLIIALFDFAEIQRRASTRTMISLYDKLELVLLKNFSLVMTIVPFLVLLSCLFLFWRLNRHHEVIAARASGTSIWQFLFPILIFTALWSTLEIFFLNPLSAYCLNRFEYKDKELFEGKKDLMIVSQTGLWFRHSRPDGSHQILQIRSLSPDHTKVHTLVINDFKADYQFERRLEAPSAAFTPQGLELYKGWITVAHQQPRPFSKLLLPSTLNPDRMFQSDQSPQSLSFWSLQKLLPLIKDSGLSTKKYELHLYSILAKLVWPLAMILLAASFSFNMVRRQGAVLLIFQGISLTFALYMLRDMSFALALSGYISLLLAAWIPTLLTGFIGASILLYREEG